MSDLHFNPYDQVCFDRTVAELEHFLLFGMIVSGKSAEIAAPAANRLLKGLKQPFRAVRRWIKDGTLGERLVAARTGKYDLLGNKGLPQLMAANFDLRTVTWQELTTIKGIGEKTAKMFVLYTRRDSEYVPLDTHILAEMREMGVENVPPSSPQNRQEYERLETEARKIAKHRGLSVLEWDKEVWQRRSRKSNIRS